MTIATHPRAYVTVTGPVAVFVSPEGHTEHLSAVAEEDIRHAIVRRAAEAAQVSGCVIELVTAGDRGDHRMLVGADGAIESLGQSAADVPVEPSPAELRDVREEVREEAQQPADPREQAPAAGSSPRRSFILEETRAPDTQSGWRALLRRWGIAMPASAAELARSEIGSTVARHWAGHRTIAVANGKGGVGKTITTAMLAAAYARRGGGNVLAWDNNDTRGTLGWRTEAGLYDSTVRDLLPAAPALLDPSAGVSDISAFVHHQSADRYDVLRSNPELLAVDQRLDRTQFDLLMHVAARYYRMVVFDSGNDESSDRWLRMVDSSYQLVIPTLTSPESAESAALLLDALRARDARSALLADAAVVVVTQSEPSTTRDARRIADSFSEHVRTVEIVPFDPALKSGPLRFDSLRTKTQDAWLRVASAAACTL